MTVARQILSFADSCLTEWSDEASEEKFMVGLVFLQNGLTRQVRRSLWSDLVFKIPNSRIFGYYEFSSKRQARTQLRLTN